VKIIDSASKLAFVHKFSDKRGLYVRNADGTTFTDTETVPNETSLGYSYMVNKNLELGGYYKYTWGTSYTTQRKGNDINDYQIAVTKYPFGNLTLAADYKINDKLLLQSYYVYIRDYKKIQYEDAATNKDDIDRGWKICQFGGNIQYEVIPDGTILLGAYNTQQTSEDSDIAWKFNQMVTYVSLAYDL
jgi:hypothetical protein